METWSLIFYFKDIMQISIRLEERVKISFRSKIKTFSIFCINFVWGMFSYPYLTIAVTNIMGLRNGMAYQIQEPEKSMDILMGVMMLAIYLILGGYSQYKLLVYSKQKRKGYVVSFLILYLIGIGISYICLEKI